MSDDPQLREALQEATADAIARASELAREVAELLEQSETLRARAQELRRERERRAGAQSGTPSKPDSERGEPGA